jgi:hypothetical protein
MIGPLRRRCYHRARMAPPTAVMGHGRLQALALPTPLDEDHANLVGRLIRYGFFLRAIIALILEWTGYSGRFAPDERTYATSGAAMALYWSGDVLIKPLRFGSDQPLAYFYLNAASYFLFGSIVPLKLLNAFVGAAATRYVYFLARALFGAATARRAAILFCFFPSLVLWSSLNIRDVWVVFLILFLSWKCHEIVAGYSHRALVGVFGAILVLSEFRDYLFYVVALPPVLAMLIGRRGHLGRNFGLAFAATVGLILLVEHGAAQGAQSRMSLEAVSKVRQDMTTGADSAFYEDVDISTPEQALRFLPIGIMYFLLSPFPWQITSFLKAFSLPEMLLIYGLVPAIIRGVHYAVTQRFRECLQPLLLTGLLTVSYALGEGNVGTLYRHRSQVIAFYIVFAAVGLELRRGRREQPVVALSA